MSRLRVYLFGNPHFELGSNDLSIHRRKAAALLAYLCLTGKPHSRDSLAALFWPDYPQSSARANLRREISRLLQLLEGGLLLIEREWISIDPKADIWVDVHELSAAIQQVQAHCLDQQTLCEICQGRLFKAVELFSGGFMAGFILSDCPEFDEWQLYEKTSTQRQMDWVLDRLVNSFINQRDFSTALPYAKRWLALDNLHEPAHRALMYLYSRSGDRSSALRQYQTCRKVLQDELGVEPEAATVQLYEEIRSLSSSSAPLQERAVPRDEIPARPAEGHIEHLSIAPPRLPTYPTPFIGRESEIKTIQGLLDNPGCRLLTLTGPGGAGKTRLALQIAQESRALFSNGVYFISLASLSTSRSILDALINVFGLGSIDEMSSPLATLIGYMQNKAMLLVLDNFEHLVSSAGILSEIIAQTERLKILVTSRQRLNLQPEWVLEIEGLAYPPLPDGKDRLTGESAGESYSLEQFSAVALFLAAAQRVKVGYTPTNADQIAAAQIAANVQGLPLAIELAAGWVGLLSIEEINTEIKHDLDILETKSTDVPDRQRSLRSVFEHSWELLSDREKDIFPGLAIFKGGFTRQAAKDILGISLRELAGLANKSLVVSKPDGRFELHELLRQYAFEKLRERPELHRSASNQHSEYFCTAMEHWLADLKSSQPVQSMSEIEAETANMLSAWDWAVRQRCTDWVGRALEPLCVYFWKKIHFTDGYETCRFALEQMDQLSLEDPFLAGQLLAWKGKFSWALGNAAEVEDDYKRSLQAVQESGKPEAQTRLVRARALQGLGNLAHFKGEAEPVSENYRESFSLYMADREFLWAADLLVDMAINFFEMHNNFEEGMKCLNQSRELRKRSGDPFGPASLLFELGITHLFELGKIPEALGYFEEAKQIFSAHEGLVNRADSLSCSMYMAFAQGDYLSAREYGEQMLSVVKELGIRRFLIMTLGMIAECDKGLGEYTHGESHIRQSVEMLQEYGELDIQFNMYSWSLACTLLAEGELLQAKSILESCVQASRLKLGKHTLARNLATLGCVQLAFGDLENGRANVREALELFLTYRHFHWYLYGLASLAYLLAESGEIQRAVEVYACVTASPLAGYSRWFEDVYGNEIRNIASRLPADAYESARRKGKLADPWQTGREVLDNYF